MERFRTILVSVDATKSEEPPQALLRAIKLAKDTGAELRVVAVIKELPEIVRALYHGDTAAEELIAAEHERRLAGICQDLTSTGVKWSTSVLRGRPFVELIREIENRGCDLLMRDASGGDDGIGALFFGSLDMRLMRNCPCPVWMVKPKPVMYFERVLVAVDPFPVHSDEEQMNNRIIDLASSLAQWERATLHVVSAWEVPGEALVVSKMNQRVLREHAHKIASVGRQNIHRALQKLANPPDEDHIAHRKGDASAVITRYAQEIGADVIVMGTLGRTGVPGMVIGNTAERVLRQVRCSVLTVKPSGFTSPALAMNNDNGESNGH